MRRPLTRLKLKEPCGCGRSSSYRTCCHRDGLVWAREKKTGQLFGAIRRTDFGQECIADVLNIRRRNFKTMFGREIYLDELINFEQEHDEFWDFQLHLKSLLPQIGLPIEMASSLGVADDDSVGESARTLIDEMLIPRAIELFRRHSGNKHSPLIDVASSDGLYTILSTVLSYVIKRELPLAMESGIFSSNTICLLFATKSLRTFRSIYLLSRQGSFNDALVLARSLYESYVLLTYILTVENGLEKAVLAPFGLQSGSYEYVKKADNSVDRRRARRKSDSHVVEIVTSRVEMVKKFGKKIDIEFEFRFYDHFNARVHTDFIVFFEGFWDNDHTYFEHSAGLAFMMAVPIMILTLNSLRQVSFEEHLVFGELEHTVEVTCHTWNSIMGHERFVDEQDHLQRMKLVMVDWHKQSERRLGDGDKDQN